MDDEQMSGPQKKSRKMLWLIIIILIAVGIGIYLATKNNNNNSSSNTASTNTAAKANEFAPASTTGVPFVATISSSSGNAVMSYDGKSNSSYEVTSNGTTTKIIYTADAYYMCAGTATCIKYPISGTAASGFNPSNYQYDASKVSSLKNTASYKGSQACPVGGGSCDVWSSTANGATSTLYINKSSHRIVEAKTSINGQTNTVSYEYKNVTITPPANATTVPTH